MNPLLSQRDVSHEQAEVCLNLWAFVDDTGVVIRLAAKAYALTGTEEEKLRALHLLAPADHLTATFGQVPASATVEVEGRVFQGAIPATVLHLHHAAIFGPLMDQVERELPRPIRSVQDNYEYFSLKLPQDPLCCTTMVYESPDGQLIARVAGSRQ